MVKESKTNTPQTFIQFKKDLLPSPETAQVVVEADVLLMVNGIEFVTFKCTPQYLRELGIGFLYNENFIQKLDEIEQIQICENNIIDIWVNHKVQQPDNWSRTSGCAGGKTAQPQVPALQPNRNPIILHPNDIFRGVIQLSDAQEIFHQSRGVHCSALNDGKKNLFAVEDIGRHNTFDKLSGLCLLSKQPTQSILLLTTGRVSSEIIQKASRLQATFVVSFSSPTTRAIQLANDSGITLIGYARRNSFNVYSNAWRIEQASQ